LLRGEHRLRRRLRVLPPVLLLLLLLLLLLPVPGPGREAA
jgi:hypothetical protein